MAVAIGGAGGRLHGRTGLQAPGDAGASELSWRRGGRGRRVAGRQGLGAGVSRSRDRRSDSHCAGAEPRRVDRGGAHRAGRGAAGDHPGRPVSHGVARARGRKGADRGDELDAANHDQRLSGKRSGVMGLDFWGKFRRATQAARADLLAAEWNRQAVITSLIASIAAGYYELLGLDLQIEISKRTLTSRQQSLELIRLQERQGTVSLLDVRRAEQLVYNAAQTIVDIERRTEQQENFLSLLLARNPGPIPRGRKLTEQPHDPIVPAGLPSALLQRRPDIQLQEARLIAANARIGVARAAFFPSISLTASGGAQSAALSDLFKGPAGMWSFIGSLTQPIFAGGRISSGVKLAEAQQKEALVVYQQTIQQAFREVSDALVGYRKNREFREQQELLAISTRDALALSNQRYRGGAASYLEVLDSNTRTFAAELGLAQAQLNELLALVQIYNALGGGWQSPDIISKEPS